MFDIGWSELLVIGVVALIAIGPKELPTVLRTVGQYMTKIRRMASEFQNQFQEAMREAEMADLKKQVDEMTEAATDFSDFNPMESVEKEIESALEDKPRSGSPAGSEAPDAATESAAPAGPAPSAPASSDASAPETAERKDEAKTGSGA